MALDPLTMKFLQDCEPGELVRARFSGSVEWGIIGFVAADDGRRKCVVVISGESVPWFLSGQDTEQASNMTCLSYGTEYHVLPEYGDPCEVFNAQGPAPALDPGMLVYGRSLAGSGDTDRYLLAGARGRGVFTLDLDQFRVVANEPGGIRAGFERWSVWMTLPPRSDRPIRVFQHGHHSQQTT
jgi:hypothetical protein